jgi:expansin (peptidoglycan-binding protein)
LLTSPRGSELPHRHPFPPHHIVHFHFGRVPATSDASVYTKPKIKVTMVGRSFVAMAALAATATQVVRASEYFTGDGTAYTLSMPSSGNCNFMSALSTASTNYAALNQDQWDSLANCGRCAEVSCIDDSCTVQNKTEVVQILDRCPECSSGDLDLSPTVFESITGSSPSRLTIQWRFVDCPSPGTIEVCLKEGSNANWVAVQPTNFVVGVESVTVAGGATTMLDGAYYFVDQSGSVDLSAVKVSITSINGDVVEGTYALTAGSCTDTGEQFASSSSTTTTTAPASTTAAPATTTAAPSTTTSESSDAEYDDSTADDYDDQSESAAGSTATEAPATTAAAITDSPAATTEAPTTTTAATTDAPATATTDAPATATTEAPTTATTTEAPASTTEAPATTTATPTSSDTTTSKCRVRSAK